MQYIKKAGTPGARPNLKGDHTEILTQKFRESLGSIDWDEYYAIKNPEVAWDFVLDNATKILNDMCPLRTFHIKNYRPDWMTNELIEQTKDRDYFFRKAKTLGGLEVRNIAKHLRNVTNSHIRQAIRDFILDELKHNENNAKRFWKVIREVIPSEKTATNKDILLKNMGVKLGRDEVAGFINDYFINVGKIDPSGIAAASDPLVTGVESETLSDCESPPLTSFTKAEVYKIVKEINVSKSSGLEHFSSFVVKELFEALIPAITHMYNLSTAKSVFPSAWKLALVVPIPKSGDLTNVKNYRPISLLPLPGKILEKLIHKQITAYLEGETLLTPSQHGFRRDHSTIHSLAQLTNYVNVKMDSKMCTLATYVDFRKAFDCVQHPVLLEKLSSLGLHKSILD